MFLVRLLLAAFSLYDLLTAQHDFPSSRMRLPGKNQKHDAKVMQFFDNTKENTHIFFKRTKYSILKNDEGHHECLFTEIQAIVKTSF